MFHVAVAILRRGGDVVLVHQGVPGEGRHWSLPGGVLEEGEVVTEALVREVLEETGVEIEAIGPLAYVVHVDSRRPPRLRRSTGSEIGYGLTVWAFEVDRWEGPLAAADPDGVVHDAALVPLRDAVARLGEVWWHAVTARYLRGELAPGSLVLERWHADGTVEQLTTIAPGVRPAGTS